MTFRETNPGDRVRHCAMEFTVREHVPGRVAQGLADVTICDHWNPRLQCNEETTFCADARCEAITQTTDETRPEQISEQPAGSQLPGDH